jgi:arsenate reductase
MKKIFTLSTCSTSKKILQETGILNLGFEVQDIKTHPVSEEELDYLKAITGSYDALFSRRAQKYKALGLKEMNLSESDIKQYILSDYTFLKRPVVVDGSTVFAGNSKEVQLQLKDYAHK